jgi:hypothetical protein
VNQPQHLQGGWMVMVLSKQLVQRRNGGVGVALLNERAGLLQERVDLLWHGWRWKQWNAMS